MIRQQYDMNNKFRYQKIRVLNIQKEEKIIDGHDLATVWHE